METLSLPAIAGIPQAVPGLFSLTPVEWGVLAVAASVFALGAAVLYVGLRSRAAVRRAEGELVSKNVDDAARARGGAS